MSRRVIVLLGLFAIVVLPRTVFAAAPADSLVKGSASTVYYFAADGKRYVFPDEGTYFSWFSDFSGVVRVTDAELAGMPLGGNVTYRPGIRLLKVQTDPKVYAVDQGGTLRWIQSESLADALYGPYWNKAIDDLPDAFFTDYRVGAPINSAKDFDPIAVSRGADTINADEGIPAGSSPRRSDTEVSSVVDAWRAYAFESINRIRAQNGKPPLVMNVLMNRIATIHSEDMALNLRTLQHQGSLGESPDDRIRYGKVPDVYQKILMTVPHPSSIGWTGENIGEITRVDPSKVDASIDKLHAAFLNEPADQDNHRTTMLSTFHPFSEVGIGPYLDDQRVLWLTEDYISPPENR